MKFFKILIILLMFKHIKPACQKNCVICSADDICLFCDSFNSFVLDSGTCKYKNIDFCEILSFNGNCAICKPKFYLDQNKCVKIEEDIENCEYYDSAVTCKYCITEYLIEDTACTKVSNINNCSIYGPTETFCELCAENFIVSDDKKSCVAESNTNCNTFNFSSCLECKDGYLKNENKYLLDFFNLTSQVDSNNLWDFTKGLVFVHEKGVCSRKIVENCKQTQEYDKCEECEEGFYSEENVCKPNPEDGGVINCEFYSKPGICLQCS